MRAWLFERRLTVMLLAFAVALAGASTQKLWTSAEAHWTRPLLRLVEGEAWSAAVLVVTGLLCVLAFALRTAAEARLRAVVYGQGQVQGLVVDGPFAWLRNPLYLGTWLFFSGATLLWLPLFAALLLCALFGFTLDAIVHHEEGLLATQHGEAYARYCARVSRWSPWPRRAPGTVTPGASAWLWASLGNLGLLSLGLFRITVALGADPRPAGALNLFCIGLWLGVIAWRRVQAVRLERRQGSVN
ncbi:MAG: methyltransferase [Pseudomonadota bacterium]